MYRITLACYGVPKSAGALAAAEITAEFAKHHPWHSNVQCSWDGERLVLQAENDVDSEGLALMDEFSDNISASIAEPFDGDLKVGLVGRAQARLRVSRNLKGGLEPALRELVITPCENYEFD